MKQHLKALILLAKQIYDEKGYKEMWNWICEMDKNRYIITIGQEHSLPAFWHHRFMNELNEQFKECHRFELIKSKLVDIQGVKYAWINNQENKYGMYLTLYIFEIPEHE